ncbi:hypothetical protein PPYR_15365, partial [Photinus pyralis]
WYDKLKEKVQTHPEEYPEYKIQQGELYRAFPLSSPAAAEGFGSSWKLCVPKHQRSRVLKECHDQPTAGHLGVAKTISRVFQNYYWPRSTQDHDSTQYTPAFLNFGREMLPTNTLIREVQPEEDGEMVQPQEYGTKLEKLEEFRQLAREALAQAFETQKKYYNLRRRPYQPRVGEQVYCRMHILSDKGPHEITRIISPVIVEIKTGDRRSQKKNVHVKDIKPVDLQDEIEIQSKDRLNTLPSPKSVEWETCSERSHIRETHSPLDSISEMAPVKQRSRQAKRKIYPWAPRRFNQDHNIPKIYISRGTQPPKTPLPTKVMEDLTSRLERLFGSPDVIGIAAPENTPTFVKTITSPILSENMSPEVQEVMITTPSPISGLPILSTPDEEIMRICWEPIPQDATHTESLNTSQRIGIQPLPGAAVTSDKLKAMANLLNMDRGEAPMSSRQARRRDMATKICARGCNINPVAVYTCVLKNYYDVWKLVGLSSNSPSESPSSSTSVSLDNSSDNSKTEYSSSEDLIQTEEALKFYISLPTDEFRASLLKKFLTAKGLTSLTEEKSTTWDNTSIDLCLTNDAARAVALIGATVFGHHKPIVINIYEDEATANGNSTCTKNIEERISSPQARAIPRVILEAPPPSPQAHQSPPMTVVDTNIHRDIIDLRLTGLRNDDGVSCYADSIIKEFTT